MGDYFQSIVDEKATEAEAQELGNRVIEWLMAEGIVQPSESESILGSGQVYDPGSSLKLALDMSVPGIEERVDHLSSMIQFWLEVVTERTVFHPGQSELCLVCDRCGKRLTDDDIDDSWSDALNEWYTSSGDGLMRCPACGETRPVTEWTYDPAWGFGCLGFTFWNWPVLSPAFVEEVGRVLGHPVKLVVGKL